MIKKLVLAMGLLGLFSVCKAQENSKPVMPQGKLLRLEYSFSGMRMPVYGDFKLKRNAETGESDFSFFHYNKEMFTKGVLDSVFTAACRIIEEERMYEYAISYSLPPEVEKGMLDGFGWRFEACFENGECISSQGRHVMPGGKGLRRIEDLLSEAARAATKEEPTE